MVHGTTQVMVYKRQESAQKVWNQLKVFVLFTSAINNVKFQDGLQVEDVSDRNAAFRRYSPELVLTRKLVMVTE